MMGILVSRINEMNLYKEACRDAAYDIVETIKYNIDEPAGYGCGYGLTETGWGELEETLSAYIEDTSYSMMETITEIVNPYIHSHGIDVDIENTGYELLADMIEKKKLLKSNSFHGIK